MPHHVTTFWYVATDDPAVPIRSGTPADPGFARRLLSRLYPTTTVASLGSFPLNRSASAGAGEIYIGSFPGLTVVQTPVEDCVHPSRTESHWLELVDAPVVLAFSHETEDGVSAFARWEGGRLVRAFSGADDRIVEDEGIPQGFERPYWAGEFPLTGREDDPLALPFSPDALLHAAHREWLGFDLDPGGIDVPVHGFATDGRREVRQHRPPVGPAMHLTGAAGRAEIHAEATRARGSDDRTAGARSPYADDEYERADPAANRGPGALVDAVTRARGVAGRGASLLGRGVRGLARRASTFGTPPPEPRRGGARPAPGATGVGAADDPARTGRDGQDGPEGVSNPEGS